MEAVGKMTIWKRSGCLECGGDLLINRDRDDWISLCLQCSHRRQLSGQATVEEQPVPVQEEELFAA